MFISTKNQSSLRKIKKPAGALIKAKICPFSTTFLKSISWDSPFKYFLDIWLCSYIAAWRTCWRWVTWTWRTCFPTSCTRTCWRRQSWSETCRWTGSAQSASTVGSGHVWAASLSRFVPEAVLRNRNRNLITDLGGIGTINNNGSRTVIKWNHKSSHRHSIKLCLWTGSAQSASIVGSGRVSAASLLRFVPVTEPEP